VGCAGARDTHVHADLGFAKLSDDNELFKLRVQGLQGGHSGIDIHRQRANANKIIAGALDHIKKACDIRLVSIQGGTAHNAIPRDAAATIACNKAHIGTMQQIVTDFKQTVQSEYAAIEKNMALSLLQIDKNSIDKMALTSEDTDRVIDLLLNLPHGPKDMSAAFKDLVETSSNLATIAIENTTLQILTSQRSSVMSNLDEMTATVEATAAQSGAETRRENEYPPWQPDMNSALLQRCKDLYNQIFDQDAVVQVIHAGLECAIIGAKYPGMDMISFGPTIENPHSPDEGLYIPSIERVWKFLVALLKSFRE